MYTIVASIPENLATALTPYREKYDPLTKLIPPNITILKPFDISQPVEEIYQHLQDVGEHQAPIKVSLAGWDVYQEKRPYLTLPLIAGQAEFISLHEHVLTGPLSPLAKQGADYRPHIVFGRLSDPSMVDHVKKTLKFEPQFVFRITYMELFHRQNLDAPWQIDKRFGLKGTVASLPRQRNPVREGR